MLRHSVPQFPFKNECYSQLISYYVILLDMYYNWQTNYNFDDCQLIDIKTAGSPFSDLVGKRDLMLRYSVYNFLLLARDLACWWNLTPRFVKRKHSPTRDRNDNAIPLRYDSFLLKISQFITFRRRPMPVSYTYIYIILNTYVY